MQIVIDNESIGNYKSCASLNDKQQA